MVLRSENRKTIQTCLPAGFAFAIIETLPNHREGFLLTSSGIKERIMNKGFLFTIFAGSVLVAGCGQQQDASTAVQSSPSVQEQAQAVAVQAADMAKQAAEGGKEAVEGVKADAQEAASSMSSQAQELLAKARQFVDSCKFNEAIDMAQQVLKFDPNNMDAKNIIETAKAKIAEMAQNKAGEMKNNLSNAIGSLGK
jgi:hypothetical protein